MPIFDFKCPCCEKTVEKLVKMGVETIKCPTPLCDTEMKKKASAPSFRLKGDGWYETDFKNK